jgi:hypothetical protein
MQREFGFPREEGADESRMVHAQGGEDRDAPERAMSRRAYRTWVELVKGEGRVGRDTHSELSSRGKGGAKARKESRDDDGG